jgi:hypothetical protein
MLNFLKSRLAEISRKQQNSLVEKYIVSKNPQTVADVEHWAKEYTRKQNQGWSL